MTWTIHNIHNAVFGKDARKETGNILTEYGCKKVALLYDRAMVEKGFVEEMKNIINASGIDVVLYMSEAGEPTSSGLDRFVEVCRREQIDGLVSLGGGSTIDTTKMAGKILANGGKATDYLGGYLALNVGNKVFEPVVAIPTTAGTGSEACWGIMCLNEDNGIKTFVRHPVTRAIVDPIYTYDLPPYITAFTGMDALAQCAESLVNTYTMPNYMADVMCREGLRLSARYLPIAVHEPHNEEAREMMCWAAMLSGYAITLRKTSSAHAIANQLSDHFEFPHGIGVGCGMAALMRYNVHGDPETTKIWAPLFGINCTEDSDMVKVGEELVKKFDAMQKDIGLKTMKELGVPFEFCDICADNVAADKKWAIVPNPPDFELLRQCLKDSWDY